MLKLRGCRSDLLILAFRLLSEEDISTLSWESAASDFCKVSMTSCWSSMMFELNSGTSLVVDVVLQRLFIVGVKRSAYGSVAWEDSLCVSQKHKESKASLTQYSTLKVDL